VTGDYEDDLRLAIELSKKDAEESHLRARAGPSTQTKGRNEVVDLVDSGSETESDYDPRAPPSSISTNGSKITPSTSASTQGPSTTSTSTPTPTPSAPDTAASVQVAAPAAQFLSERAKLEKERLERQRKRKLEMGQKDDDSEYPESDTEVGRASKKPSTGSNNGGGSQAKAGAAGIWPLPSTGAPSKVTSSANSNAKGKAKDDGSMKWYWDGEIRQTANMHVDKGEGWKLSGIIGDVSSFLYHPCSLLLPAPTALPETRRLNSPRSLPRHQI
jgi:tyrosyl-DNA phosphodiesterase 1